MSIWYLDGIWQENSRVSKSFPVLVILPWECLKESVCAGYIDQHSIVTSRWNDFWDFSPKLKAEAVGVNQSSTKVPSFVSTGMASVVWKQRRPKVLFWPFLPQYPFHIWIYLMWWKFTHQCQGVRHKDSWRQRVCPNVLMCPAWALLT